MKTVAAISFLDNHSLSMDIEGVTSIDLGPPMPLEDGSWTREVLIRSANGTVALQLLADSPERLRVAEERPGDSDYAERAEP
ncbi:MAG: hypothetical protein M0006_04640 [Magnetospirillum sp.]|nr:hypothetical protein [Magnetospirillum sp.]